MKSAENVDGKMQPDLPSMKKLEIMDGKLEMKLSSMKTAKNVDGRQYLGPHAARLPRLPCQIHGVRVDLAHLSTMSVPDLLVLYRA